MPARSHARRRAILPMLPLLAAILLPDTVQARDVTMPGTATLGDITQPARFVFACSENAPGATGTLAMELRVAGHAALRPRFDFDVYEGPDANAGRRTRFGPTREIAMTAQPLSAAGWITTDPDDAFAFGIMAARRGDGAALRALGARIATALGQGRLVWIQGNTRRNGAPIVATLEVDPAAVAAIRQVLAPCLAQAGA